MPSRPGKVCRGVLFFDTFETLWAGSDAGRSVQSRRLDAWLRQLAKAVRLRGVLIVVAGRDELRWAEDDADWKDAIETHLLGGFSRHDAQNIPGQAHDRPSAVGDGDALAEGYTRHLCRSPGTGRREELPSVLPCACADIVDNSRDKNNGAEPSPDIFIGIPSDQVGKKLADRFLKSLPSEQWELWVRELSLTPSFDERAALALDRERHHSLGRVGWKQLCRYSFLEPQPEGYFRLHKTMREVLRSGLGDEAADVDTWFRDHWLSREDSALAFFHQWSLDPATMLNGWLAEHESALKNCRIPTARALLDDWSEIPLDGLDRRQLGDPLWARTHVSLGLALSQTPIAPRAPSLNAAITHYESALRVYTEEDFPSDWAKIQNGLGSAYLALPTGDRDENLRRAIAFYESALRVHTEANFPSGWARIQNGLGSAYSALPAGDRSENLRRAIACYQSALRVHTEADFPTDWANIQIGLGSAYLAFPTGDRSENLLLRHRFLRVCAASSHRGELPLGLGDYAEQPGHRLQ